MKKILPIIILTFSSMVLVSCSDKKKAEKSYDEFKEYVSMHRDSVENYYDKEWSGLESKYNEKRLKSEEKMNDWSVEMKAEYASLQSDWDSFKEDYLAEKARRENAVKTESMVSNLFPQGIAMDLNNVNANNLLDVHTHFVSYVESHKDEMSREQWDRVEQIWESLGTRKNEVEKDLKTSDNLKIAEQKIKFGAIKATNRPSAKTE